VRCATVVGLEVLELLVGVDVGWMVMRTATMTVTDEARSGRSGRVELEVG
jgi:hypothetical protein